MKTNILSLSIAVFVLLNMPHLGYCQWQQCEDIYGGNVSAMLTIGSNIFIGTGNGVYRTSDNGNNWIQSGLISRSITSFIVSGNNIFAGTEKFLPGNGGIYKSTDNGLNWISVGLNDFNIFTLFVLGNYIFAATDNWPSGGVFVTSNNGINWNLTSINSVVYTFTASGNNLFAGQYNGGVSISTDNGLTWSQTGLNNISVYALAAVEGNIIAGGYGYPSGSGFYYSSNNGQNWIQTSNSVVPLSFAVRGNIVYAGTNNGCYYSTNKGQNWIQSGWINERFNSLAIFGNDIYAGTSYHGVFLSTNNGLNWAQTRLKNVVIHTFGKFNNSIFLGTTNLGIYMSSNSGQNWNKTGFNDQNGLGYDDVFSMFVSGNTIFAGTGGGVVLSTNNGQNWSFTNLYDDTYSLAVSGNNVYAGNYGSIFRSTNFGQNWTQAGLNNRYVYSLAISGNNLFAGVEHTVYLSTDNCQNWVQTSLDNKAVFSLAISGSYIYAGTETYGIYSSTNNGQGWVQSGLNNKSVYAISISGGFLFAGTSEGVYLSTNFGQTWIPKNQGFDLIPIVYSLFVDNNYVYAGTNGCSVWKRSYNDIIGVQSNISEIPGMYSLEQNYPNPFNSSSLIRFSVPKIGLVKLSIYDIQGREIKTMLNDYMNTGTYEIRFNGSDLPSGIYFCKMISAGFIEIRKMALIK